jgi:hypothetical protein
VLLYRIDFIAITLSGSGQEFIKYMIIGAFSTTTGHVLRSREALRHAFKSLDGCLTHVA